MILYNLFGELQQIRREETQIGHKTDRHVGSGCGEAGGGRGGEFIK